MKLIAGSSNQPLAAAVAQELNIPLAQTEISQFANSENAIRITEDLKDEKVILLQSFSRPTDQHIIEFLLLADAIERAGAEELVAVIPWLGYSLQDKIFRPGEPISAKVIANMVSASFMKRIILLDLHNSSIPGFFSKPTKHLSAMSLLADHIGHEIQHKANYVVSSPDFGGLKRAFEFAEKLDLPLVKLDKRRDLHTRKIIGMSLSEGVPVEDKTVLIFDDVILSGGTVMRAADILKQHGAKEVIFLATHGLFVNDSLAKLEKSNVDRIIITNSIAQKNLPTKVSQISIAKLIAQNI